MPVRLVILSVAAALVSTASAGAPPTAPQLPAAPENLAQSWVAYFKLDRRILRVGETVTGRMTISPIGDCGKGHRCVTGFTWPSGPGLAYTTKGCRPKSRTCTWKVTGDSGGWQVLAVSIDNDVGYAHSDDAYIVTDKNVLDGTVTDRKRGVGVPGVKIVIRGTRTLGATTNAAGYYNAILPAGRYRVQALGPKAKPKEKVVQLKGRATANFQVKQLKYLFSVVTVNGAKIESSGHIGKVGDEIAYSGEEWDDEGSPIALLEDDRRVARVAAAERFSGRFTLKPFPDGRCKTTISARQDGTTKTLHVEGRRTGAALLADGTVRVKGGRKLENRSYYCEGEELEVGADGALVWVSEKGLQISNRQRSIELRGNVSSPDLRMALSGSGAWNGAVEPLDIRSYDPASKSGVQNLGPQLSAAVLGGFARSAGNLSVTGGLTLDGGVLFVDGDLTLVGGLSGMGAVFVTGTATIRGPVDLTTDATQVIATGGPLLLYGK